jgi:hypothetical protein
MIPAATTGFSHKQIVGHKLIFFMQYFQIFPLRMKYHRFLEQFVTSSQVTMLYVQITTIPS